MKTNQQFTALALLVAFFISSFAYAQNEQNPFKKKWNPEAKGTAIGAGIGGVAGAIIHKRDRKVGAGVGLAVGAAAGYGVGKVIDNRKKKAAAAARAAEEREYAARTARDEQRELRSGSVNRQSTATASRAKAPVALATTTAAAHALAQQPAPAVVPLTRNGFLLNTTFGDPNTAYPTSEYRRKSW